jgi:hypothetical protein
MLKSSTWLICMYAIPVSFQKRWPKMPKSDYSSIWVYEKGKIKNQKLIVNFTSTFNITDVLLSWMLGFSALSWLSFSRSMDLMPHLLIVLVISWIVLPQQAWLLIPSGLPFSVTPSSSGILPSGGIPVFVPPEDGAYFQICKTHPNGTSSGCRTGFRSLPVPTYGGYLSYPARKKSCSSTIPFETSTTISAISHIISDTVLQLPH